MFLNATTLLALILFALPACSEPQAPPSSSQGGSTSVPQEREYAELFDLSEEGAPEMVAFLMWSFEDDEDVGQRQALLDVPADIIFARLEVAYEGTINDTERFALVYLATEVGAPEMLPLFEQILESPVPSELIEIDPHNGALVQQMKVYPLSVVGTYGLYEDGVKEARALLLTAASHPLVTVRGVTADFVSRSSDESLIEEVRALLPDDEKDWL